MPAPDATEPPGTGSQTPLLMDGSEAGFYSAYQWSLNPVLTVRELFMRLREALDQLSDLRTSWQREECKANLGLCAGAITCTVDDYLGEPARNLSALSQRFPAFRGLLSWAQTILDVSTYLLSFPTRSRVFRWRQKWISCVNAIWEVVAAPPESTAELERKLRGCIGDCLDYRLPQQVLELCMQLPAGYRSQDLAHHDAFALADIFAASQGKRRGRLVVVGPRSMGAYFAPAVRAKLNMLGWTTVSWCTVRPKRGISLWERRGLGDLGSKDVQVLVADESPNTGNTFFLMIRMLRSLGVSPERIFLLAAMHPTRPDWRLPENNAEFQGVTLLRLEAHRLYKNRFLEPAAVLPLLQEYFRNTGSRVVEITQSRRTQELNSRLHAHFQDGFDCRLKRVFDVRLESSDRAPLKRRIIAKSVGWGWLGYHAYFAGKRLAGFVPDTLGLRNGLLFTAWLEGAEEDADEASSKPPVDRLATYVAARARELRLPKDPIYEISIGYGWTGWRVLLDTLREAFGPVGRRLKIPALHRRLGQFACPFPALTDGNMKPEDWIRSADGFQKVDFEHHNFGRTEPYVVDPAYDLAAAAMEFRLSPQEERLLVASYALASGDADAGGRMMLWKLLHGRFVGTRACAEMARNRPSEVLGNWHERFYLARNFLVYEMNRFGASLLGAAPPAHWTGRLFFMDLDGVFDSNVFGFPQTTTSGLLALATLRRHGFSVIPDTARSVKDVRQYTEAYGLPGGIAELGCMFVDAVRRREISLVEPEAAEQLSRCRESLQSLPAVFVDPNYRTAIRAYRFTGLRAEGIPETEIRSLLDSSEFDRLTFVPSSADTTIIPKGIGKGPALQWVRRYLDIPNEPVAAIGDGDADLEMLRAANAAFAPANCSKLVRRLVAAGQCEMTRMPRQKGLLEASRRVIHADGRTCDKCNVQLAPATGCGALIQTLMEVAERTPLQRFLSLLKIGAL